MTKSELVTAMAQDAKINKVQAQAALDSFISNITGSLAKKEKTTLIGFGTFSHVHKPARDGRNPATGQPMKIAAKNVAKFKPGKALEEALN